MIVIFKDRHELRKCRKFCYEHNLLTPEDIAVEMLYSVSLKEPVSEKIVNYIRLSFDCIISEDF